MIRPDDIDGKPGTILLVEDHRDLADTVIQSLETAGFIVDYAADGEQAMELATRQSFDAIILDIMLPGIDGMELCSRLRNDFRLDLPILMLTARDELDDKLEGFQRGADDYLVKPFQMAELQARVVSLINRKRGRVSSPIRKIDDLILDVNTKLVSRNGQSISLSPTAFNILNILMRESPKVISRNELEQELWGDNLPDSDALRSHLYTLRKAVDKPFPIELIKTVKGQGLYISADQQ